MAEFTPHLGDTLDRAAPPSPPPGYATNPNTPGAVNAGFAPGITEAVSPAGRPHSPSLPVPPGLERVDSSVQHVAVRGLSLPVPQLPPRYRNAEDFPLPLRDHTSPPRQSILDSALPGYTITPGAAFTAGFVEAVTLPERPAAARPRASLGSSPLSPPTPPGLPLPLPPLPPGAALPSKPSSTSPVAPKPSNYVKISREPIEGGSSTYKGAVTINTNIKIPGAASRKNLEITVREGSIDTDVFLTGDEDGNAQVPPVMKLELLTNSVAVKKSSRRCTYNDHSINARIVSCVYAILINLFLE